LGAQDTYYVGTIKGIGRIYQQTFIDTYTKVGFVKLHTSKHAITAADLLNDRVLPWYEEHSIRLLRILTDRGTEYNGSIENHEYQLYLAIKVIDHSKTKAYHPQTNGICERFHRTIKEEFYDIAFRKKIYTSLDELQADLDQWMAYYNPERPHSGKYCNGVLPCRSPPTPGTWQMRRWLIHFFRRRWLGKILIHSLLQRKAASVRACLDYYISGLVLAILLRRSWQPHLF
jgi:hypothetical protein